MQKLPLVSVIMPAHNAGSYIKGSIESVLSQSYKRLELLVIDDASSDETAQIVSSFVQSDSRVKLLQNRTNHGVADTRNVGIKAASGQYVAFLDSDDKWDSRKLAKQVEYMVSNDVALTYGNYDVVNENGKKTDVRLISESQITYKQLLKGNRIGLLTAMVTRDVAIQHLFPKMKHEDYAFWLSILKTGVVAYRFSSESLAKYQVRANSVSANKMRAARWTWDVLRHEGLSIVQTFYYFSNYALMVVFKRR